MIGYEGRADKWLDLNARYKWGDWGEQFVQVGQFKQPIGLEALSAAKRSDLMSLVMVTNPGGYVSGLWNINGQSWRYTGGEAALAVGPATGMWQVGLRHDVLDLNDNAMQGGCMETLADGLNWYRRSHFKAVFDHMMVGSERPGIEDDPDIAEARLQLRW